MATNNAIFFMFWVYVYISINRKNMRNQISFKANINVIPYDKFRKLWDTQKPTSAYQGEIPSVGQITGTEGMACCTGGAFNNGRSSAAFHYASTKPWSYNPTWVPDYIKFLGDKDKIKGFLTGGYLEDFPTLDYFRNLFQQSGISHSIIFGHINGEDSFRGGKCPLATNFFYSLKDDTYHVAVYPENNINSVSKLLQMFQVIKIADGDKLFINGQEVSRSLLDKVHEIVAKRIIKSPKTLW